MSLLGPLLHVLLFTVAVSSSQKCERGPAVNITEPKELENGDVEFENFRYPRGKYFRANGTTFGCKCDVKPCVRKCCPEGERFKQKVCTPEDGLKRIDEVYRGLTVVSETLVCEGKRYLLNYTEFTIQENGDLLFSKDTVSVPPEGYCVEFITSTERPDGLACSRDSKNTLDSYSTGMIISMPFLLATFLVYALLPDRNLPAKALMCYVMSLLFAYIMLVTIQLNTNLGDACKPIAFLCYLFFMVSFFWMSASCIDIWLTFSGIKGMTGQRTQERKRFVYYSLYAWGVPLIMTAIVITCTYALTENDGLYTGIGGGQCWFRNGLTTGIYFYFPIAIILIANIVLFGTTALKIRNVQRDTRMLNAKDSSKHEKDKQRFNLYVKLLFAMGINWTMEVISWAVIWKVSESNLPSWIWYLTDFCNAMYGVVIFFIFVFKRNIWMMLKKRYLQFMGRPTQAHSMGTSTNRTTVSQVTSSEA